MCNTLKLEIVRFPERYHTMAANPSRCAYYKLLGNHTLSDPICKDVINAALDNSTFWDRMQIMEQAASKMKESATLSY
jgi:hypothetical protein